MSGKKIKLIVSDFHLGIGVRFPTGRVNIMEDFLHDHRFSEFLEYYSQGEYSGCEIELVFNGDMLNLIQVDYKGHYTSIITETVSVEKIRSVIKGHPKFFESLKKFLSDPKHSLTYIIGNHDQEMMWEKCQSLFEQAVGTEVLWKTIFHHPTIKSKT